MTKKKKKGSVKKRKNRKNKTIKSKIGRGFFNSLINKIPVEMHIPGYSYCGPGTKLQKRLARGDPGINPLDSACKNHDIVYSQYRNSGKERDDADKILASTAWDRIKSKDATFGERMAASTVFAGMKAKRGLSKIGGRIKKMVEKVKSKRKIRKKKHKTIEKSSNFKKYCNCIHTEMIKNKPKDFGAAVKIAIKTAKQIKSGRNMNVGKPPRIIPIPKIGGVLPLIPIFAGLSAIGSLIGSTAGIVKAIRSASEGRKQLAESERHNQTMESIALGRNAKGSGLFMRPYRTGYGLYMSPYRSKN